MKKTPIGGQAHGVVPGRMRDGDGILKRSVNIAGHRTSVSVEEPFWTALRDIAERQYTSVSGLIASIDRKRDGNLSSAIRLYVLRDLQSRI
ncbi:MAG: ribbon-helix-helix domain-containing protein [Rhodospirillaceae bacterium]